jgi:hypothetical protein
MTPSGLVSGKHEIFDKNPRLETVVGFLLACDAGSIKNLV